MTCYQSKTWNIDFTDIVVAYSDFLQYNLHRERNWSHINVYNSTVVYNVNYIFCRVFCWLNPLLVYCKEMGKVSFVFFDNVNSYIFLPNIYNYKIYMLIPYPLILLLVLYICIIMENFKKNNMTSKPIIISSCY